MHSSGQGGSGCGPVVVFMIATLTFVLGLLVGVGSLFGFLKADPQANLSALGINAPSPQVMRVERVEEVERECPPCEASAAATSASSAYALVYPIEETLRVEGEIDREAMREYVIKRRSSLQQCYKRALEKDPTTKGEATLQFSIAKSGKIIAAVTRQDTVDNEELKACMLDEVKRWDFKNAKPQSDLVVVKLDVLFVPLGAGGP